MENSLTGDATAAVASTEPTTQAVDAQPSAEQNQETISTPETVSETTTAETAEVPQGEGETQTQTNEQAVVEKTDGASHSTDDGLAKFAKSQGFDPENLTDGERRALKIAHDNQKFARSQKVAESKASVDGDIQTSEMEAFRQEFRQYQATKQAEQFFAQEGRDDSLAPVMSEIIEEKKTQHGVEFARELAGDLNLLYDLARVRTGAVNTVDAEAIRREERESINKNLATGVASAHATNSKPAAPQTITADWIRNTYDPRNPEHVSLMEAAGLR